MARYPARYLTPPVASEVGYKPAGIAVLIGGLASFQPPEADLARKHCSLDMSNKLKLSVTEG